MIQELTVLKKGLLPRASNQKRCPPHTSMRIRASRLSQVILMLALSLTIGCAPIPGKYLQEADSTLKFSWLAASPELYQNRLVVLGAVIVAEEVRAGDLWLHVKNRP